ncbi:MAG: helix-turn-helix domain-containing protein [Defluviitaleaceae bacterium]|nr:helix-turn-helix domain-containing protein [Defluviitaleaceae bacterium]
MNERLKEVRKYLGLTQRELCSRVGLAQGNYANMETGTRNIRDANVKLICATFQVNEDWLRTGIGEMFIEAPNRELEELLQIFDKLTPALQKYVLSQARGLLELQNEKAL